MSERTQPSFIQLLENAVALARQRASEGKASGDAQWRTESYETVARNFEAIIESVRSGQWAGAPGAGLGATRALSEWGLEDDDLYTAVKAAEDHHVRFGSA